MVMCVSAFAACGNDEPTVTQSGTSGTTEAPNSDLTTDPSGEASNTTNDTDDEPSDTTQGGSTVTRPAGITLPEYPEKEKLELDKLGAKAPGTVETDYEPLGEIGISSLSQIEDPNGSYYLTGDISDNDITIDTFNGILDGCGYTVTTTEPLFTTFGGTVLNLTLAGEITYSVDAKAPLATTIISGATILNIKNECDVTVSASSQEPGLWAGGFALYVKGKNVTFANCEYAGTIINRLDIGGNSRKTGGFVGNIVKDAKAEDAAVPSVDFIYCTVSGKVEASSHTGGLVGQVDSPCTVNVAGCLLKGTVRGLYEGNVGGLLGHISGSASINLYLVNCANNGTVVSLCSGYDVGGLVGTSITSAGGTTNTFKWCTNYGDIVGYRNMGGIAALVYGYTTFDSCANHGKIEALADPKKDISATGTWSGGLVGFVKDGEFKYTDCINYGDIVAHTKQARCGGIVGENQYLTAVMTNCVNFGNVTYDYDNYMSDGETVVNGDCRIAGISAGGTGSVIEFYGCVNFGNLKHTMGSGGQPSGGIVGFVPTSVKLVNCMNYGDIDVTAFLKDGTAVGTQLGGLVGFAFGKDAITITGCINAGALNSNACVADFLVWKETSGALIAGDMTISNNYYVPAYEGDKVYGPFLYNGLGDVAKYDEISAKCTATTKSSIADDTDAGVAKLMNTAAGEDLFECVTVIMTDGVARLTCVVPISVLELIDDSIEK